MRPAGEIGAVLRGAALALVVLGAQPAVAVSSMAVQPGGGIVLVGQLSQPQRSCGPTTFRRHCRLYHRGWPALARLGPDGALDTGFGSGGGIVDFRGSPTGGSFGTVAVDGGGGILVSGGTGGMRRFEADGDPDSGFSETREAPFAILPQPDGSLISATGRGLVMKHFDSSMTLSRLGPAGESLSTIGSIEGTSTSDDVALGEVLQAGESFLAAGRIGFTGAVLRFRPGAGPGPDPSFAAGAGILRPGGDAAPWISVSAIAADGDGFLIAGKRRQDEAVVARYDGAGLPDLGFGDGGVVRLDPVPTRRTPVALFTGPGGMATVVGQLQAACPSPRPDPRSPTVSCAQAFVQTVEPDEPVARPSADTPLPPRGSIDAVFLGDGRLLVSRALHAGAASRFAVARFGLDGSVDLTFGEGGVAEVAPCTGKTRARRRAGCIGSARPRLRIGALGSRRPRGTLRLADRNELDPIVAARLLLPAEIGGVRSAAHAVRVATMPRTKARVKVVGGRIVVEPRAGVRDLEVRLRPGALRRVAPVGTGHKLVFRVLTTFKDGSTQRSAIRLAP